MSKSCRGCGTARHTITDKFCNSCGKKFHIKHDKPDTNVFQVKFLVCKVGNNCPPLGRGFRTVDCTTDSTIWDIKKEFEYRYNDPVARIHIYPSEDPQAKEITVGFLGDLGIKNNTQMYLDT